MCRLFKYSLRPVLPSSSTTVCEFPVFGRYVFEILGNDGNIITWYYYLVPCRLSTDPKIPDLEWLRMAILREIFTITNSSLRIYFYLLTGELVYITRRSEMCGSEPWSAEYLGSAEGLRIFRRRYIVGTLTNKANIFSIQYYLVHYRLSTDSITRDLEWPWMAI